MLIYCMQSIYLGKFASLNELHEFSQTQILDPISESAILAFDSERWLERQYEFYVLSLSGAMPRNSNLPLLAYFFPNSSVLDIGGGSGWIRNFLPGNSSYRVFEQLETRKYFSTILNSKISYIEDLEEVEGFHPNIVYANSSFQYFDDREDFFKIIELANPNYVLIDDLMFSSYNSFYSLQRYYGRFIETFFPSRYDVEREMTKLKFTLEFETSYKAQYSPLMAPTIELLDGTHEDLPTPRSLLFRRNKSLL